jgi:glycosyltransferase involved in cell wall biosynthesis
MGIPQRNRTHKLPSAHSRKAGWSYVNGLEELKASASDEKQWPRISIVTPNYNQEQFLEDTVCSVLLQAYPDLEYMIIDGGSADGSVEIIRKYEKHLTFWISEPDRGQSHALNKGFSKATGRIFGWLNSDDILSLGALRKVARAYCNSPKQSRDWIVGRTHIFDHEGLQGERLNESGFPESLEEWLTKRWFAPQPSTFFSRKAWEKAGPLREDMHYAFDREYWVRLRFLGLTPFELPDVLSRFRLHQDSKTVRKNLQFLIERNIIRKEYAKKLRRDERRRVLNLAMKVDEQIGLMIANSSPGIKQLPNLMKLLVGFPRLLLNRSFWGAFCRVVGGIPPLDLDIKS